MDAPNAIANAACAVAKLNIKRRARSALIALSVVGNSLLQSACSDFIEARYSTLVEAEKDGAFSRGWLPETLPANSRDIREIHNIDTNEVWCMFAFDARDADAFRAVLRTPAEREKLPRVRPPGVSWWPAVLRDAIDRTAARDEGLELYREGPRLFAVNWTQGVAYFHEPSS